MPLALGRLLRIQTKRLLIGMADPRKHTLLVEASISHQVAYVESDPCAGRHVPGNRLKIVPVHVAIGVGVLFQIQIIFIFNGLLSCRWIR